MEEQEQTPIEQQQPEVEDEPKKSKKGIMSEKKLENLAKAREARKANIQYQKV